MLRWHNDAHLNRRILTLVGMRWPFSVRSERVTNTIILDHMTIERPDSRLMVNMEC